MGKDDKYLYGGISGVELLADSFDLGKGVTLRKTYAHLMSPCLMAFLPPGPEGYHQGPLKPANGGFSFDIKIEIRVPNEPVLGSHIEASETIWWIAALLRLEQFPFLTVPVISDHSFDAAAKNDTKPTLEPFETTHRILSPADNSRRIIEDDSLGWIREKWFKGGKMLVSNKNFYAAFKAFDYATIQGKTSSSLLALWGGLEQLFTPSGGGGYRIALMLASYLEPSGEARLGCYKKILKLYGKRSAAAHTAKDIDNGPLIETYVLMRNALVRIVDENRIPTQKDLEERLFGCGVDG